MLGVFIAPRKRVANPRGFAYGIGMKIALSADHAGVDLKNALVAWLKNDGHDILDLGTHGHDSVDYPRFGAALAEALADGRATRGITICGSGIGVAIAANRNPACRCAQVSEPLSASLASMSPLSANVCDAAGRSDDVSTAA